MIRKLSPDLTLAEAIQVYIDQQTIRVPNPNIRFIAPRTLLDYEQYGRALLRFYRDTKMQDIHVGTVAEYYRLRGLGGEDEIQFDKPAGANKIRQEVGFLTRLLKKSGCWDQEWEENFQPLQRIESDIPLSLSPDQQRNWLDVAASKSEWVLIYLYSLLAFATAANHQELRRLKIMDVNLYNEYIEIRAASAKNKHRVRTIPIDHESGAIWAVERLLERARSRGSNQPHHYLFPLHYAHGIYIPTKPMTVSGLKKKWHDVREAAGVPWFNPKDTRHTALTRWAESGMPIHVMMALAGHISPKMQNHYIHISEAAKRKMVKKASAQFSGQWGVENRKQFVNG
jgi:site-specific recombinase XerD